MRQKHKGYEFLPPDPENPYSCADWLVLEPASVTLLPKEGCIIKCTITVPRAAKGARYAGIVCGLDVPEFEAESGGQVELEWSMATVISLTVAGTRYPKSAEITSLEAVKPRASAGSLMIRALLKNTSEVHVFGSGRLTLRDGEGRRIRETPLGQGRGMILPGAELEFSSLFGQRLLPGDYLADVAIHYGGDRGPAQANLPFTVTRESLTGGEMIHQVAFYVMPQYRILELSPGSMRALDLQLTNQESEPVSVQASLQDIEFDELGRLIILDSRDGENSAAPWVTLQPAELVLKAGERRTLRYKVTVPRDSAAGSGYGCLLFTASMIGTDGKLRRSQAGIVLLASIPKNTHREAQISKVEVSQDPIGGAIVISTTLQNQGNIYLANAAGQVILERRIQTSTPELDSGIEIVPSGVESFERISDLAIEGLTTVLLPGTSRIYPAVVKENLPAGEYRVSVQIDYTGDRPASFTHRFTVEAESEDLPGAVPTSSEAVPALSEMEDIR